MSALEGTRVTCPCCGSKLVLAQTSPYPEGVEVLNLECPGCHTHVPLPRSDAERGLLPWDHRVEPKETP